MSDTMKDLIMNAKDIVIIQADNPDADSLASSLALEHILGDQNKSISMYCGVDIPGYLRYMDGWDRVVKDVPKNFDLSIIVDTSAVNLLDTLDKSGQLTWVKSKPCIIIDHHATPPTIDFASCTYIKEAVSTGELIYGVCKEYNWDISLSASELIAISILSDSIGLMSESTTAHVIRILADLVDSGVSLAKLDNARKQLQKKSPEILEYKGRLLQRIRYSEDRTVAYLSIPWTEIEKYSHQYNPAMLIMDEMRMVQSVKLAIVFKIYPNNKITGKIRANYGYAVADKIAESFGGGGHPYAAGFKLTDGKTIDETIGKAVQISQEFLEKVSTT